MADAPMTLTTIAETILRDVKRYWQASNRSLQPATDGEWLSRADVLSALTAAMDPAIAERAGEVLEPLSKLADDMDRHATDEWDESELLCKVGDTIRALAAQNAALRAERDEYQRLAAAGELAAKECRIWQGQAEAAEAARDTALARVAELEGALTRQADNMAFVMNHVSLPDQYFTKFNEELALDRATIGKE